MEIGARALSAFQKVVTKPFSVVYTQRDVERWQAASRLRDTLPRVFSTRKFFATLTRFIPRLLLSSLDIYWSTAEISRKFFFVRWETPRLWKMRLIVLGIVVVFAAVCHVDAEDCKGCVPLDSVSFDKVRTGSGILLKIILQVSFIFVSIRSSLMLEVFLLTVP